MSSFFRNSTLETEFRSFPNYAQIVKILLVQMLSKYVVISRAAGVAASEGQLWEGELA